MLKINDLFSFLGHFKFKTKRKKHETNEKKCYTGYSTEISTQKNCRLEIVYDSLLRSLSILLLAAKGAKLIGPHPTGAFRSIKKSL